MKNPLEYLLSSGLLACLGVTASSCSAGPVVLALATAATAIGTSGVYDRLKKTWADRKSLKKVHGNHDLAFLIGDAISSVLDEASAQPEFEPSKDALKKLSKCKLDLDSNTLDETELPNIFKDAVKEDGTVDFGKVELLDVEGWRTLLAGWLVKNKLHVKGKGQQTAICEYLVKRTAWFIAQHLKKDFEAEGDGRAYAGLQLAFFAKLTSGLDSLATEISGGSDEVLEQIRLFKEKNTKEHQSLVRKLQRWLQSLDERDRARHEWTWKLVDQSVQKIGIQLENIHSEIVDVKDGVDTLAKEQIEQGEKLDLIGTRQEEASEASKAHGNKLDRVEENQEKTLEAIDEQNELLGETATLIRQHMAEDIGGEFLKPSAALPVSIFTGRDLLIDQIVERLLKGDVQLIGAKGMGGCGKTELARKVATEPSIAEHFAGGVCEVNFNGFSRDKPLTADEGLDRAVRQFLSPKMTTKPLEPNQLELIYRNHLSNEPILLICDNVRDKEQLEKLLPAPENWSVLVTGRNSIQLPELSKPIEVDRATREESIELLRKITDNDVWESQLDDLAGACGDYMLALTSAGAAAAGYHGLPEDFVEDLNEQKIAVREGVKDYGDVMEEVVASLQLSLAQVADAKAISGLQLVEAWHRLSVFSGHFDALAAHVIWTGEQVDDWNDQKTLASRKRKATKALSLLVKLSLLQSLEIDDEDGLHFRFQFHDIYRDIASGDVAPDTRVELQLELGEHLKGLLSYCNQLYSFQRNELAALRQFDRDQHQIESTWSDLVAMNCSHESSIRRDRLVASIPSTGIKITSNRLSTSARETWLREALQRAEIIEDKEKAATNAGNLGLVLKTRGDLDGAEEMHRKALQIEEELGRKEGMANQFGNLGLVLQARGDLDGAEEMLRKSNKINEELGRKEGMAKDFGNLGIVLKTRGDLDGAEDMYREALKINNELGRKEGMAIQFGNLGNVLETRGDLDGAKEMWNLALELFGEIGAEDRGQLVKSWLESLDEE